MKLKNFVPDGASIILWIVLFFVFVLWFLFLCFRKEPFQKKDNVDFMTTIETFCSQHFGEDWGIDHVYRYNDKIMFVVVQTHHAVIDLSIQPENRAIIIENIKGVSPFKKRIYRF